MSTLVGKTPANSFRDLLQTSNGNKGIEDDLVTLEDGEGDKSTIQFSKTKFNIQTGFMLGGVDVSATAAHINVIAGTPAEVRANLGLAIGSAVQAYDAATAKTNVAQTFTKDQHFGQTTLTDQANIAWDLENNKCAIVTLAASRTLDNPSNMKAGSHYSLYVKQDATGGRTLTFGDKYKWPSSQGAPTLTTSIDGCDILHFDCDGVNMYGSYGLDYS